QRIELSSVVAPALGLVGGSALTHWPNKRLSGPYGGSSYAGGRRGKEREASLRAEQRLAAGGRRLPRPEPRPVRGVAAGRSAERACERSSDWRRGAAGSPDPEPRSYDNLEAPPDPDRA